ncbi:DUF192 domain-containing protein [Marinobacter segnicrescens]|uniref:DUF192 domain-containing protein n=1 Tax=Marinobacter segnicrescens TaxID=430453 RepID=UPI003A93B16E
MTSRYRIARLSRALIAFWLVVAASFARSSPPQHLESWEACLITSERTVPITLEHAVTAEQRRWGLMERQSLPARAGMLFFYDSDRPATAGFWMYRTRIPLDIAWLDEDGVILAMDTMTPCETDQARDCPTWPAGVPHRNVLEMNAGFFEKHHVDVGDKLVANLNDNIPCPMAD